MNCSYWGKQLQAEATHLQTTVFLQAFVSWTQVQDKLEINSKRFDNELKKKFARKIQAICQNAQLVKFQLYVSQEGHFCKDFTGPVTFCQWKCSWTVTCVYKIFI